MRTAPSWHVQCIIAIVKKLVGDKATASDIRGICVVIVVLSKSAHDSLLSTCPARANARVKILNKTRKTEGQRRQKEAL